MIWKIITVQREPWKCLQNEAKLFVGPTVRPRVSPVCRVQRAGRVKYQLDAPIVYQPPLHLYSYTSCTCYLVGAWGATVNNWLKTRFDPANRWDHRRPVNIIDKTVPLPWLKILKTHLNIIESSFLTTQGWTYIIFPAFLIASWRLSHIEAWFYLLMLRSC